MFTSNPLGTSQASSSCWKLHHTVTSPLYWIQLQAWTVPRRSSHLDVCILRTATTGESGSDRSRLPRDAGGEGGVVADLHNLGSALGASRLWLSVRMWRICGCAPLASKKSTRLTKKGPTRARTCQTPPSRCLDFQIASGLPTRKSHLRGLVREKEKEETWSNVTNVQDLRK